LTCFEYPELPYLHPPVTASVRCWAYVVKQKDGRRNRYQIQAHLPLPEPGSRERAIGEVLTLLSGAEDEATG
jgi:hypothetical protein